MIDLSLAPTPPPIRDEPLFNSSSKIEIRSSDFIDTGFSSSTSLLIAIALIWLDDDTESLMFSPPKFFISGAYSRSGSITIISSLENIAAKAISSFDANDLPEPDTPSTNPLPLRSNFRLHISRLCDIALIP